MAGSSIIGALRVMLGLDTAQFSTGVKESQSAMGRLSAGLKTGFLVIAAAAAAAATAIAASLKHTIDKADEMGKAAQKIGVPIEKLSALAYAADLSGVSFETLSKSMGKLAQSMSDSLVNTTGNAARAFSVLGIAVKDNAGNLRSSSDVLADVAAKFKGMEDGAGKTALAMAIFGKSGKELIPLLNSGADGLAAMTAEAEKLGIVIDQKTFEAAERFNDSLTRLGYVQEGMSIQITGKLAPALNALATYFNDLALSGHGMDGVINVIVGTVKTLASAAVIAAEGISNIGNAFVALKDAASAVLHGATDDAKQIMLQLTFDLVASGQRMHDALAGIWSDGADKNPAETGKRIAAPLLEAAKQSETAASQMKTILASWAEAQKRLAAEGMKVFMDTRTPIEQMEIEIQKLNDLVFAGAINWDTYSRAVFKAQDAYDEAMKKTNKGANDLTTNLKYVFDGVIVGADSAGEAVKRLGQKLLELAAMKFFEWVFGAIFNVKLPAGSVGTGSIPGFAAGGSYKKGRARIVGENGPELDVPDSSGSIIPNHMLGGGGSDVTVNVYAPPGSKVEKKESSGPRGKTIDVMIDEMTAGAISNPGSKTNRAMRQNFPNLETLLKGRG